MNRNVQVGFVEYQLLCSSNLLYYVARISHIVWILVIHSGSYTTMSYPQDIHNCCKNTTLPSQKLSTTYPLLYFSHTKLSTSCVYTTCGGNLTVLSYPQVVNRLSTVAKKPHLVIHRMLTAYPQVIHNFGVPRPL